MSQVLATSCLPQTWGASDDELVFLGEWCRRYDLKEVWAHRSHKVHTYHWNDRDKLEKDYVYLLGVYERTLEVIVPIINDLHRVEKSHRYWRILLGPWLGSFIQILYDRFENLRSFKTTSEDVVVAVASDVNEILLSNDMGSFRRSYSTDIWNYCLYSKILTSLKWFRMEDVPASLGYGGRGSFSTKEACDWKNNIFRSLNQLSKAVTTKGDAFLCNSYLSRAQEFSLQLKDWKVPRAWFCPREPIFELDKSMRQPVVSQTGDSFELLLKKFIFELMPKAYLEGYASLKRQAYSEWPKEPGAVFSSNVLVSDLLRVYIAQQAEDGTPIILGHHGGHYGSGRWFFQEDYERSISDSYVTWGWGKSDRKIVPLGRLKKLRKRAEKISNYPDLRLVTCTWPRQSYTMYSSVVAGQYMNYLRDQFSFVNQLEPGPRRALKVRLYPNDLGWCQETRWKERFSDIEFDSLKGNTEKMAAHTRIYVSTYNATTFLESFACGIPTVMFWDEKYWELRDEAMPYFNKLKEAGVFFTSPIEAANQVSRIWDDPTTWWCGNEVQKAVSEFCEVFSRDNPHLLEGLREIVSKVD